MPFLFALPGLVCWFFFILGGILPPSADALGTDIGGLFWGSWWVAVPTALASLMYFGITWRRPEAGYMVLCLILNLVGLAFSALMLLSVW